MFPHSFVHSLYKFLGGACIVGEVTAFLHSDEIKQIFWLVGGAVTFAFHFAWNQVDQRRRSREQDLELARRNRELDDDQQRRRALLNSWAKRVAADFETGKPLPSMEVLNLLFGHEVPTDPAALAEILNRAVEPATPTAPAPAPDPAPAS